MLTFVGYVHKERSRSRSIGGSKGAPGRALPGGPNSFIFIQFTEQKVSTSTLGVGAPLRKVRDPQLRRNRILPFKATVQCEHTTNVYLHQKKKIHTYFEVKIPFTE